MCTLKNNYSVSLWVRVVANISSWLGKAGRIGDRHFEMMMWEAMEYHDVPILDVNRYILTGKGRIDPSPVICSAEIEKYAEEVHQDGN